MTVRNLNKGKRFLKACDLQTCAFPMQKAINRYQSKYLKVSSSRKPHCTAVLRIRITLMRTDLGFHCDRDLDPAAHVNADPEPASQNDADPRFTGFLSQESEVP
jgi:hypothetical protein